MARPSLKKSKQSGLPLFSLVGRVERRFWQGSVALAKPALKGSYFSSVSVALFAGHAVGSLGRAAPQPREDRRRGIGGRILHVVLPRASSPYRMALLGVREYHSRGGEAVLGKATALVALPTGVPLHVLSRALGFHILDFI